MSAQTFVKKYAPETVVGVVVLTAGIALPVAEPALRPVVLAGSILVIAVLGVVLAARERRRSARRDQRLRAVLLETSERSARIEGAIRELRTEILVDLPRALSEVHGQLRVVRGLAEELREAQEAGEVAADERRAHRSAVRDRLRGEALQTTEGESW